MSVLNLARWQFAMTSMFHFLFVPLTLGLSILVAIMETLYVRTGNQDYLRLTKFFGKLFLINFAMGVVTGITMEFQFGTNWSEYSKFVGDIFGAPLAIEALFAFFLESTFLGVWIFGWKKLSAKAHAFVIWLAAFGTNLSAFWILVANGWMQHPVAAVLRNGRAELTSFSALISNKFAILEFLHTVTGGYILAGFFVMGISAYHLLKRQNTEVFLKSFKIALIFALIASIFEVINGDLHAYEVGKTQPTKLAAMEAVWETQKGAPVLLIAGIDEQAQKNTFAIGIPRLLSLLATHNLNGEIKGLKDLQKEFEAQYGAGNYIPPVKLTFWSFHIMVTMGLYFVFMCLWGSYLLIKNKLAYSPVYLKLMLYSIPLPYLAGELGWTTAEVGRQPWIVYGLQKTAEAFSPMVSANTVWISLIGFIVLYGGLAIADIYLLTKYARKGLEERPLGEQELY
jgi:cytochrome d ubiquinol oxidase subunit I